MRNAAEREKRSIAAVLDAVVLGVRAVQFAVQVLAAAFRAFFVGNLTPGLAVVGRGHGSDPAQGEGQGHKNGQGHGAQLVHCSSSLVLVGGGAAK